MSDDNGVRGFNSMEEAFAYMAEQRERADAGVVPLQRTLLDGQEHWYYTEYFGLAIAGYIPTVESLVEIERGYYDMTDPMDKAEFEYTANMMRNMVHNNIVQVKAYSTVEPNGEPGSTHVVACLPITEEAFDEFIANGFRMGKDTPTLIRNVVDAMSTIGEQMGEAGK